MGRFRPSAEHCGPWRRYAQPPRRRSQDPSSPSSNTRTGARSPCRRPEPGVDTSSCADPEPEPRGTLPAVRKELPIPDRRKFIAGLTAATIGASGAVQAVPQSRLEDTVSSEAVSTSVKTTQNPNPYHLDVYANFEDFEQGDVLENFTETWMYFTDVPPRIVGVDQFGTPILGEKRHQTLLVSRLGVVQQRLIDYFSDASERGLYNQEITVLESILNDKGMQAFADLYGHDAQNEMLESLLSHPGFYFSEHGKSALAYLEETTAGKIPDVGAVTDSASQAFLAFAREQEFDDAHVLNFVRRPSYHATLLSEDAEYLASERVGKNNLKSLIDGRTFLAQPLSGHFDNLDEALSQLKETTVWTGNALQLVGENNDGDEGVLFLKEPLHIPPRYFILSSTAMMLGTENAGDEDIKAYFDLHGKDIGGPQSWYAQLGIRKDASGYTYLWGQYNNKNTGDHEYMNLGQTALGQWHRLTLAAEVISDDRLDFVFFVDGEEKGRYTPAESQALLNDIPLDPVGSEYRTARSFKTNGTVYLDNIRAARENFPPRRPTGRLG